MARGMFGPSGQVSDGLQMKNTLEPAVGVGFFEGGLLCIQGKGLTWEDALAHAETRRAEWQFRCPDAGLQELNAEIPIDVIKSQMDLMRQELSGELSGELSEDLALQNRVKEKVRKIWGV